jgi:hypothetical protein
MYVCINIMCKELNSYYPLNSLFWIINFQHLIAKFCAYHLQDAVKSADRTLLLKRESTETESASDHLEVVSHMEFLQIFRFPLHFSVFFRKQSKPWL